ncbi:hypothetical protein [Ramlibacter albus]|uniref:Uncharacterized protein n=1 Tax=Ramlibacter albus TaxID=2079448 RepID=A0A923MDA7_9BURK|nr:hypothetical protein [Ramlibacter albus]MBC5767323.1 hypothetical protein [Ramlibacter albus]
MGDYWLTQFALEALGWFFIGAFGLALLLATWLPKGVKAKLIAVAVLLGVTAVPVVNQYREYQRAQAAAAAYKARLQAARALLAQRCAQAGEKIYKTVQGARGVFLTNLRPFDDMSRPTEALDPAGDGSTGPAYITTFFAGRSQENSWSTTGRNRIGAYEFVETQADDGEIVRYSDERKNLAEEDLFFEKLSSTRVPRRSARFGIEWSNISTPDDKQLWIAGNRIRVMDLDTQEVIAERVAYVMDQGQGSTSGERSPWSFALYNACPELPKLHGRYPQNYGLTRNFVEKVLKP